MQKTYILTAIILGCMVSSLSFSQDLLPGLWDISVETRVAASPDFAPPPFQASQCITAEDARDPSKLLGGIANPGASGCVYKNKNYSGNVFRFTMQCSGGFQLETRGEITFTSTTMNGTMNAIGTINGQKTEFINKVSARRTGNC